jgi:hypothetical protein
MLNYPLMLFSSPEKAFPQVVVDESGKAFEFEALQGERAGENAERKEVRTDTG